MASCTQLSRTNAERKPYCVAVSIGEIVIGLRTGSAEFAASLQRRYGHFVVPAADPDFEFELELTQPFGEERLEDDVRVWCELGTWFLERGDFSAQWEPQRRRGIMRHLPSPYAVDAVLRITHTLLLADRGGFLLHASSAIRHGRAFVFAGISGAGKTTMARLAPPDAQLLSDEVSYVCRVHDSYRAYGTPFAGELATIGENSRALIAGVFLLEKATENRIEPIATREAVRALLRHTLFFAHEPELVEQVFRNTLHFVERVPVQRFCFAPTSAAWELIQ